MMLMSEIGGREGGRGGGEGGGGEGGMMEDDGWREWQAYGGGLDDRADHAGAEASLACRHLFCDSWIVSISCTWVSSFTGWESRRRTCKKCIEAALGQAFRQSPKV